MQPDFGPNVTVFDLGMPTSQIQAAVDAIANQQVSNQFAPQRYALLFMPGTYDSAASPLDSRWATTPRWPAWAPRRQTSPSTATSMCITSACHRPPAALRGWSNGVWNQVFSGVMGAPAQSFPNPTYTTLATSPVTREKPFLYVDPYNHCNVFVPALRRDSQGTTWANGPAAGTSIPIESFFIAKPTDSAKAINVALARGQNLIFTPGVYPPRPYGRGQAP